MNESPLQTAHCSLCLHGQKIHRHLSLSVSENLGESDNYVSDKNLYYLSGIDSVTGI